MAMLPKLKIKALVSFPANVFGGTGISIDKANGNFTIDLNYSEFAFQGTLPTGSNVLVWDPVANVYTLVPPSATGGISDAPTDGKVYGRKLAAWVDAWASPVLTGNPTAPTPAPLDNDTSVATTAFVTAAISSIPAGTPPPAPATAIPLADGAAAVGVSLKYAREDHIHPAGAAGSGDVVGPSGAVDSNLAAFNTTTGKLIKDSGVPLAAASGAVRYDLPQGLTASQQAQGRSNIGSPIPNVLINGDFRIQQDTTYVSGAVLAAGAYGHDQWKAGASGGDYSFTQLVSSTQITIASGKSLIQPIENVRIVGGSYVLTWTGTAQARAGVNTLTPSGAYAASPLLITGQTAGTVMSVEFNAGTLGTVKLESGSIATPFVVPDYASELAACQRYLRILTPEGGGYVSNSTVATFNIRYTGMRSAPTISSTGVLTITDGTADFTQSSQNISFISGASEWGIFTIGNFSGLTSLRPIVFRSATGLIKLNARL